MQGDATHDKYIEQTKAYVDQFSKEGLRTLLLAKKDISQREYDSWVVEYQKAERTLVDRDNKVMEAAALIETDMTLVGSTAIEDKLQEDV